jgi:aminopeptidase N
MFQTFFSDILVAHEVAHQWWGNTITTAGYRDEWMMEALANYSALLLLERKRGAKALDEVLEKYREHLLMKGVNGQSIDAAGPICFGARLDTSQTPDAYRAIVYEKGTWVIHMLRRRLGDAAFFNMLRELHTRFLRSRVTTADLRQVSAKLQPQGAPDRALEQFFASYVEGVGIPTLRLQTKQKRTAKAIVLTVDLEQTAVNEDFAIDVPIELDFGRGKTEIRWIRTDGTLTSQEWTFPTAPVRVQLDPRNSLLAIKR